MVWRGTVVVDFGAVVTGAWVVTGRATVVVTFGAVTTGVAFWPATVVGVTVVVGAATVVGVTVVVGATTVVVGVTGRSSRFLAGGMIAGLLGGLVTVPRMDTSQQREPDAGVTRRLVRRL